MFSYLIFHIFQNSCLNWSCLHTQVNENNNINDNNKNVRILHLLIALSRYIYIYLHNIYFNNVYISLHNINFYIKISGDILTSFIVHFYCDGITFGFKYEYPVSSRIGIS